MINPSAKTASGDAEAGLVPQLRMMLQALWNSPVRNRLLLLGSALVVVIVCTAYGQILLNRWNQPFYDAIARRDLPQFLHQLAVFGAIAGFLLVLNVAQRWLGETAKVRMREGLVRDLLRFWLAPGRAFRLAHAGKIGVNPDQRLHEDARHLTELSADLAIGLLQATILMLTFVDVLWKISSEFAFHLGGHDVAIPGYMVWAAVLYSASASWLSYRVGRGLIGRNEEHYAREAELRYSLVRVNEQIDAIALAGGEADEASGLEQSLDAVLGAMRRLVIGLTRLTWVTAGSGWFTLIAPIIAAAPLYFAGRISFGGLMVASGAFMQVQSSLRWFVDNFSTIADWRATLLRVASFRRAMVVSASAREGVGRIAIVDGAQGRIALIDLVITSNTGLSRLVEGPVVIAAGERVLVSGESGSGKTLLFRALAGLWPWGGGRIERPAGEDILFMPRNAYLPPGSLRRVLAYPQPEDRYSVADCSTALAQVGLQRLVPLLGTNRRWDHDLRDQEQHALAFARVWLRAPAWIVFDDVLGALDAETLAWVNALFAGRLASTGIIHVGAAGAAAGLFFRTLHLIKSPALSRAGSADAV